MRIEQLALENFRNLEALRWNLDPTCPSFIVLQGNNAQGKTNILEALYLCATGRSFRHAPIRDLLQHGQTVGSVRAVLSRRGVRHEVCVQLQSTQRRVLVDGRVLRQATGLLELFNIVAFFPDDLRIAKGGPEERRRFLDRAVANSQPGFVDATLAYHRALRSRNALLRGHNSPDKDHLATYDAQLVHHGILLHTYRVAHLQELLPVAQKHFSALMRHAEDNLEVDILPGIPLCEDLAAGFAAALVDSYPRDRARGITNVGPHRADLRCRIGGYDSRLFASQGQQRSIVLALKLAEVVCLSERLQSPPILLLDDVSSELDRERLERLFTVVQQVQSQIWVSTTGMVALPVPAGSEILRIHGGRLLRPSS